MVETTGLLNKIKHHYQVPITVNENCKIPLPDDILERLLQPHKLAHYCFVFLDQGSETYKVDLRNIPVSDGQMIFGCPNQVFSNPVKNGHTLNYKIAFDENTLAMLPQTFPFLLNPLNTNTTTFTPDAKARVRSILSTLFQLLHHTAQPGNTPVILAYLNTLLTEFNSAYFGQGHQDSSAGARLSKYIDFKLMVEKHLYEQPDVHTIAGKLSMTTSTLYSIVKECSGVAPKVWMTNRLMLEAQRKLQYATLSVKELAYDLGFNDPDYFSRLFKKSTGKSVRAFLADRRDLSGN